MPYKSVIGVSIKDIQLADLDTGTLADSDGTSVKCDKYLTVIDEDGNDLYLPLYDTVE